MQSILKILLEVESSQAFERLEPLKDPSIWKKMKTKEKSLLAKLLLLQGKKQLEEGNNEVIKSFEIANQLDPLEPELYFQQGVVFATNKENIRCLQLAKEAFTHCLTLDPNHVNAIYHLGLVHLEMGRFEADSEEISLAVQHFEHIENFFSSSYPFNPFDFHWKWGQALSSLGLLFGEPSDFHEAIRHYSQAAELGAYTSDFFNDYANTVADLAALLNQCPRFLEALALFQHATQIAPDEFEGWFNTACCLHKLSEFSEDPEYLNQADEVFSIASQLSQTDYHLWVKWGQLTSIRGKYLNDIKIVEESLDKFAKADDLEPNHPLILNQWAETELYLGMTLDKIEYLNRAQEKIIRSIKINPEDAEAWYLYGSCSIEMGRYYDLEDYFHQAIDHFQYGVSLDKNEPLLWYGLSLASFALGEISEEQHYYEKAAGYCAKVIEIGGDVFPQFWNDWGVALMKLGEISENPAYAEHALQKFEHAFKYLEDHNTKESVDLEWIYNYACCFNVLGNLTNDPAHFERAILLLSRVIQQDPHMEDAKHTLAIALSNFGEVLHDSEPYEKAISFFRSLLNESPDNERLHLDFAVTLVNLALLIQDLHQPERHQALLREAEVHMMQAAALGLHQAYYQLAGLYSIVELYPQAMRMLEKAQNMDSIPSIEELLQDDWLDGLRQTAEFHKFLQELTARHPDDELLG